MEAFGEEFRAELTQLMSWRRDVRHFKTESVAEALVNECLDTFSVAPSVGLSEPWRIIRVRSALARSKAIENFEASNQEALATYSGEQSESYARLKLAGMHEAPEHLAIFCDDETAKGHQLGAQTMPEMRRYSVVSGVTLMWLRARSLGLGLGWVSILDPERLKHDLEIPDGWSLIGYFCLGYPKVTSETPELEEMNWETRRGAVPIEER